MNPTRETRLQDLEMLQRYCDGQRNLSSKDMLESKLAHLELFITELEKTTSGQAELKARRERFGECKRMPGEKTPQYYGRLRRWLDRDVESRRNSTPVSSGA